MNNKIQAKDLINVGLFTVIYFVLGCCVAIPIGMVPVFLPILGTLWVILTGIPFMLFLTRVKTFGMVTLMAVLSGLLMGLTGMGFFGVPCGLVFGLLGDLIIKSGEYKSIKKGILGYAVFSLWMVGTYIPMYFMVGTFVFLRQIYLAIAVPFTHNIAIVFAGWPVTWIVCMIGLLIYYFRVHWLDHV